MNPHRYGMILVVSGPSGSGKSTLCAAMRREFADLEFSVSCTTRPPRGAEQNGIDYHFLTPAQFAAHVRTGDFLEYAEVHGHCYGTLKSEVWTRTERGIDVLLDIDVQGATQVRKRFDSIPAFRTRLESVFIAPPAVAELERRLRSRGADSDEDIRRRLENAGKELAAWHEYSYVIVNGNLAEAGAAFRHIIHSLRLKCARYKEAPFHER